MSKCGHSATSDVTPCDGWFDAQTRRQAAMSHLIPRSRLASFQPATIDSPSSAQLVQLARTPCLRELDPPMPCWAHSVRQAEPLSSRPQRLPPDAAADDGAVSTVGTLFIGTRSSSGQDIGRRKEGT